MPSSHDLKQDDQIAAIQAQVNGLRKRIDSNVRRMKQISDKLNARLAALAPQSGQPPPAPRAARARRKTPSRGAKK